MPSCAHRRLNQSLLSILTHKSASRTERKVSRKYSTVPSRCCDILIKLSMKLLNILLIAMVSQSFTAASHSRKEPKDKACVSSPSPPKTKVRDFLSLVGVEHDHRTEHHDSSTLPSHASASKPSSSHAVANREVAYYDYLKALRKVSDAVENISMPITNC